MDRPYCHYDGAIDARAPKFLHCLTLTESSRSSLNRDERIRGRIRVTWLEEKFHRRDVQSCFFPRSRLLPSAILLTVHRNLRNGRRDLRDKRDDAKLDRHGRHSVCTKGKAEHLSAIQISLLRFMHCAVI